jgi:hypothetical protein
MNFLVSSVLPGTPKLYPNIAAWVSKQENGDLCMSNYDRKV